MDIRALISAGLDLVKSQSGLVGTVANIAAAAPKIGQAVQSGLAFLDSLKANSPPETHAEIEAERVELLALRGRVIGPGGHADQTIDSLGDQQ